MGSEKSSNVRKALIYIIDKLIFVAVADLKKEFMPLPPV